MCTRANVLLGTRYPRTNLIELTARDSSDPVKKESAVSCEKLVGLRSRILAYCNFRRYGVLKSNWFLTRGDL